MFKKAVEDGNIKTVHKLLKQGADPNSVHNDKTLVELAMEKNKLDTIKLLVQYGAKENDDTFAEYIMGIENSDQRKEMISHIIKYNNDNSLLENFLHALVYEVEDDLERMEIFKLLLDHGLTIHNFIKDWKFSEDEDEYTTLHFSITENKIDFVLLLLERGADINKKTGLGVNCISIAAKNSPESMIELLVKKGARNQINERLKKGKTPLHIACETWRSYTEIVHILCKYGADPNILDDHGNTPLLTLSVHSDEVDEIEEALIEELAWLSFMGKPICPENLDWIQEYKELRNILQSCLKELQIIKNHKFYSSYTLFDVLKVRPRSNKLTLLTKNHDFVEAFKSSWDRKSFKRYGKILDDIFEEAVKSRDAINLEEIKLYSIFKGILPELVICKLAYLTNEDLFFIP